MSNVRLSNWRLWLSITLADIFHYIIFATIAFFFFTHWSMQLDILRSLEPFVQQVVTPGSAVDLERVASVHNFLSTLVLSFFVTAFTLVVVASGLGATVVLWIWRRMAHQEFSWRVARRCFYAKLVVLGVPFLFVLLVFALSTPLLTFLVLLLLVPVTAALNFLVVPLVLCSKTSILQGVRRLSLRFLVVGTLLALSCGFFFLLATALGAGLRTLGTTVPAALITGLFFLIGFFFLNTLRCYTLREVCQ